MAHRTQYSKDLVLPPYYQEQRLYLERQIRQVKQKQQQLIKENIQKLSVLEKRLLYGKKKIFTFDKQMNRITLADQIAYCNKEIDKLKSQIFKEQQDIKRKKKHQAEVKERFEKKYSNKGGSSSLMSLNRERQPNQQRQIEDPQQEIMKLTHQIIRLKKSLQQVRSKYSDNFTQYKLRQEYEQLTKQNEQLVHQLKNLQTAKGILVHETNYEYNVLGTDDEVESFRVKKEYELILKEKNLLNDYYKGLYSDVEERKVSQEIRVETQKRQKLQKLQQDIEYFQNQNQILQNQIQFKSAQIQKKKQYGRKVLLRLHE